MIMDAIINVVFLPVVALLALIPEVSITIPAGAFEAALGFFDTLGYMFPMGTIGMLLGMKYSLHFIRITIALVIRIKSFIPTMGA